MQVDEAPDDDSVRQSYNFAPGYHGLVYRADGPDYGANTSGDHEDNHQGQVKQEHSTSAPAAGNVDHTKYKLQAMKWGALERHSVVSIALTPFETIRPCSLLDETQP